MQQKKKKLDYFYAIENTLPLITGKLFLSIRIIKCF